MFDDCNLCLELMQISSVVSEKLKAIQRNCFAKAHGCTSYQWLLSVFATACAGPNRQS